MNQRHGHLCAPIGLPVVRTVHLRRQKADDVDQRRCRAWRWDGETPAPFRIGKDTMAAELWTGDGFFAHTPHSTGS